MYGRYSKLQARINQLSEFAIYVPCAGHSLNVEGVKAADCNIIWLWWASVFLFCCFYSLIECIDIIFRKIFYCQASVWHTMVGTCWCCSCSVLGFRENKTGFCIRWQWTDNEYKARCKRIEQKHYKTTKKTWKQSFSQFFGMTFMKEWTKQATSCSQRMWTSLLPQIFLSLWKPIFRKLEINLVIMNLKPGVCVQIQITMMRKNGNENQVCRGTDFPRSRNRGRKRGKAYLKRNSRFSPKTLLVTFKKHTLLSKRTFQRHFENRNSRYLTTLIFVSVTPN